MLSHGSFSAPTAPLLAKPSHSRTPPQSSFDFPCRGKTGVRRGANKFVGHSHIPLLRRRVSPCTSSPCAGRILHAHQQHGIMADRPFSCVFGSISGWLTVTILAVGSMPQVSKGWGSPLIRLEAMAATGKSMARRCRSTRQQFPCRQPNTTLPGNRALDSHPW